MYAWLEYAVQAALWIWNGWGACLYIVDDNVSTFAYKVACAFTVEFYVVLRPIKWAMTGYHKNCHKIVNIVDEYVK